MQNGQQPAVPPIRHFFHLKTARQMGSGIRPLSCCFFRPTTHANALGASVLDDSIVDTSVSADQDADGTDPRRRLSCIPIPTYRRYYSPIDFSLPLLQVPLACQRAGAPNTIDTMPEGLLRVLANRPRTNGTLPRDGGDLDQVTAAHRDQGIRPAGRRTPTRTTNRTQLAHRYERGVTPVLRAAQPIGCVRRLTPDTEGETDGRPRHPRRT